MSTIEPRRGETHPPEGDATGGIIPYKNPSALMAYYFGVFSFIPCLGIILGIAAFVLGIMGLRYRKLHPEAKGSVHAWIGIVLGGLFALLYTGLLITFAIGAFMHR